MDMCNSTPPHLRYCVIRDDSDREFSDYFSGYNGFAALAGEGSLDSVYTETRVSPSEEGIYYTCIHVGIHVGDVSKYHATW